MDNTLGLLIGISLLSSAIACLLTSIWYKKKQTDCLAKSRAVFDGINDAVIIHDIEGKIIDANRYALEMYGISKHDLSELDIMDEGIKENNISRERLQAIWKQVTNGEMAFFPWVAKKPHTGELFDIEVALRSIDMSDNKVILATVRNTTESNKAASEIRKLAAVVEQVDESVVICDKDSRIIYVNPFFEKITGYSHIEVMGEKPSILKSGLHDNRLYQTMWETIESGKNWTGILTNKKKDGSLFDEEITIFPLKNSKGDLNGYAAVKRDISQKLQDALTLKKAKESAEKVNIELESAIAAANAMSEKAIEASKAKSEFIASVSHELRTPLNIILGSIELLSETNIDTDQGKYLKVCRNACESLLEIISGILDISKIEAGQLNIENMEFEPEALVADIILLNEFRAKSKNIDLKGTVSPDVPSVLCADPARIRQILINLVNNAIKFTEMGEVCVKVETVNPTESKQGTSHGNLYLKFTVSDTGIGINTENIDRIFDEFIQADTSITRKFGGTGLGLTISKKLVKLMGGAIWAESKEGEGSKFIFTVRCAYAESGSKTGIKKHPKQPRMTLPDRKLKILLAEDIPDNRMLISRMISEIAEVETAGNGAQAVEKFKSGNYDLIIMDIQMPELDGYSAAGFIRGIESNEKRAETPLIALTAFATSEELKKSQEAGFSGYVTKPVKKATLIEAISQVMEEKNDKMNKDDEKPDDHDTEMEAKLDKEEKINETDQYYLVIADAAIEDLIPFFIENRKIDLQKIENAINLNDYKEIMRIGHSLKGTGGSYGFHVISEIGAKLEDAAEEKNLDSLLSIKNQMSDYLEKVCVRFE